MHIVFIITAQPAVTPFPSIDKRPANGVGFLIAVLEARGHSVKLLDQSCGDTEEEIEAAVCRDHTDAVCISVYTPALLNTFAHLEKIHRWREAGRWSGRFIVGGPHSAARPGTYPAYVDHEVVGEAEDVICDVVENGGDRIIKQKFDQPKVLDHIPPISWRHFVRKPYLWTSRLIVESPIFPLNTTRGCPFKCTFCGVHTAAGGRPFRAFSIERVVDDINRIRRDWGGRAVFFREDNSTVVYQRIDELCAAMRTHHPSIPWFCESHVMSLRNTERVETLARSGCKAIFMGCESGSDRVLEAIKKQQTTDDMYSAIENCKKFGIKTIANFMVGLPYEEEQDLQNTLQFIKKARPDTVFMNVFVGLPGTPLYDEVVRTKSYVYEDACGQLYGPKHDELVRRFSPQTVTVAEAKAKFELSITRRISLHGYSVSNYFHAIRQRALLCYRNGWSGIKEFIPASPTTNAM